MSTSRLLYSELVFAQATEMDSQKGSPTPSDKEVIMKCVKVTKTLNLRVKSFENIADVKEFSELEDIETKLQKVFFTKKKFVKDQELDYERKDGYSVHLNLHLGVKMQIRIEVPWRSAKEIPLDVHSWDTISDVKTKFQDKEGTPANQLTIFYDRKQLDDDFQTLAGYDIKNDSILHAVLIGEDKIKITVRPPGNCDPIQVMVKLCSTVVNLKRMIHWMSGFPVEGQILNFNEVLLENGWRLADYQIQIGSVIDLDVRNPKSGKQMLVFVKTLTGKTHNIYVDSSDTVHNLKTAIKNVEGIPEKHQKLLFGGRRLEDDARTLGDYHITKGSAIRMVPRPCGS